MNAMKFAPIRLIMASVLTLMHGGFSYVSETHNANSGPISLRVNERQTVMVPVWAGVGAIVVGGGLLLFGIKTA